MGGCYRRRPDCRCCAIKCKESCVFWYPDTPQGEIRTLCRFYEESQQPPCRHPGAGPEVCPDPCPFWIVVGYRRVKPNWLRKDWKESDGYRPGYFEVSFVPRRW